MISKYHIIKPDKQRVYVHRVDIVHNPLKAIEDGQNANGRENQIIKEAEKLSLYFSIRSMQSATTSRIE